MSPNDLIAILHIQRMIKIVQRNKPRISPVQVHWMSNIVTQYMKRTNENTNHKNENETSFA